MYTLHDDDDNSKVVLQEQYEKSILSPLRRRLSDVGTTATSTIASPTFVTSTLQNNKRSESRKVNEKNVKSTDYLAKVTTCEQNSTPDPSSQSQQSKKLKSCLSVPTNKKRQRSSIRSPKTCELQLKCEVYREPASPIIEPSRKKQKYSDTLHHSIVKARNEQLSVPLTSRKAVHFAPSSAVEYEVEVPVCHSLTPIPAETAIRRYPTEMKAISIEETELLQITKQNNAILKAFDDMYDADSDDHAKVIRRRKKKKYQVMHNRRKSFYIPSTCSRNTDIQFNRRNDSLLNTI